MNARFVLLLTLAVLSAGCALFVAATVSAKIRRSRRIRTLARLAAPQRMLVLEVSAGEDDDGNSRAQLSALSSKQWASIRPAILSMLSKVHGTPAEHLIEVIQAHGEVDRARAKLRSRSALQRARGAHLLGIVRDTQSVPRLVELLDDPAPDVRFVAARSLGQIGDADVAAAVLHSARGVGGTVGVPAWVAAESLLAMGSRIEPAVVDGLVDEDPRIRAVAVMVTTHAFLPDALDVVRERLKAEPDDDIRASMVHALGRLGERPDVEVVLGFTAPETPVGVRRTAVRALGDLGDATAAQSLRALIDDEDRAVAAAAATALTRLGPTGVEILHTVRAQGATAARIAAAALHLARLREMAGV